MLKAKFLKCRKDVLIGSARALRCEKSEVNKDALNVLETTHFQMIGVRMFVTQINEKKKKKFYLCF